MNGRTAGRLAWGIACACFAMAATALGAGILLDATVVRALLVPALVSLFGRWNWWLPSWAGRLLRVEPSPATPEALPIPVALEREREIASSGTR